MNVTFKIKNRIFLALFAALLCNTSNLAAQPHVKAGFDFFDHVYTINLKQNTQRRDHVLREFERVGVKNLQIFDAIDKDAPEVTAIMRTKFVKNYPPCYICKKVFCKCRSNYLMKHQVGNWLSFINVFKDIVKNNYQFVLITEDDVKFVDNAKEILAVNINAPAFAANGIDLNKPILIRLEKRYDDLNDVEPTFNRNKKYSNACFIVNKLFAESFLRNLTVIDRTSDMFIHFRLMELDPTIQDFSIYPMPAYQLSDHPQAIFYSEILPKGIDPLDQQRKQQHKFRIGFWEYLYKKFTFKPLA